MNWKDGVPGRPTIVTSFIETRAAAQVLFFLEVAMIMIMITDVILSIIKNMYTGKVTDDKMNSC